MQRLFQVKKTDLPPGAPEEILNASAFVMFALRRKKGTIFHGMDSMLVPKNPLAAKNMVTSFFETGAHYRIVSVVVATQPEDDNVICRLVDVLSLRSFLFPSSFRKKDCCTHVLDRDSIPEVLLNLDQTGFDDVLPTSFNQTDVPKAQPPKTKSSKIPHIGAAPVPIPLQEKRLDAQSGQIETQDAAHVIPEEVRMYFNDGIFQKNALEDLEHPLLSGNSLGMTTYEMSLSPSISMSSDDDDPSHLSCTSPILKNPRSVDVTSLFS